MDFIYPSYLVQQGDTLSEIAQRFYLRGDAAAYKALAEANGIADPDKIQAGERIILHEIMV